MGIEIGIIIGMVVGIVTGVMGFWVFNRKQRDELDSLRKAKTDLTAERDNAQKDKVDLENRFQEANAQIETLDSQLAEKTAQIDTLTNRFQEANTQIETLDSQLAERTTQVNTLTKQLQEADVRISTLEGELTEKTAQIDTLTKQLQEAGARIDTLTNQLKQVSASNENALQLLHLFELSSQLTALALYSEVSRATNLGGKNKELYAEYKELYAEYKKSLDRYDKLREEVERKAKRRLVRSGATAALSLLPGVGILQIVGDLTELVNFVSEIAEGTADVYDMLSVVELSVDLMNLLEDFIDIKSIESLQPEISSDQGSEKAKQKYQSIFKEVFSENLAQDNKEPDASDFNNFLKAMIARMKEFVDLMPESERRHALNRLIGNFGQFGIALYTYHESPKPRADRSLPAPKN